MNFYVLKIPQLHGHPQEALTTKLTPSLKTGAI